MSAAVYIDTQPTPVQGLESVLEHDVERQTCGKRVLKQICRTTLLE